MLSLETRDTWTFSLSVTVGAATEVYANTASSAYAAAVALVAWANAGGRAWTGTITFAWTWERQPGTGGAVFTLVASGYFTLDGGAAATLGFAAMAFPDLSVVGDAAALGTWAPKALGLSRFHRFFDDAGDAAAAGAIRPGSPATAAYRPEVEAIGTAQDAARLTYLLGRGSNPRRAWFYRTDAETWVYLAVGAVERTQNDGISYTFTFDCRGQ